MFKDKLRKGLICLLAIGVLASTGWAMGKKPAQEQAMVEKLQAMAQPEAKKNPGVAEANNEPAKAEAIEQTGTQTAEAQVIEPKLVMEYKLPEGEEIVDVIFGEATMTVKEARALGIKGLEKRQETELVKVRYPKVVYTTKIVKFLDKSGKILKTISLEKESWIEKRINRNIYKNIEKDMIAKKNAEIIGLIIREIGSGELFYEEADRFILLDLTGDPLWEKQFDGRAIFRELCSISENGEIIVIHTEDTTGSEDYPDQILYVYDKNGKEILTSPPLIKTKGGHGEYRYGCARIRILSPNGRYLAVHTYDYLRKYYNILFYDLKKKTFWDAEEDYIIDGISNDGIAKVEKSGDKLIIRIDLKKYLGE
ncbi:MAG: hypothetical protein AB1414_05535 [bacterium]